MVAVSARSCSNVRRVFRCAPAAVALSLIGVLGAGCDQKGDEQTARSTAAPSAATAVATAATASADDGSIPPPASAEMLPIQAGQWVRYAIQGPGGARKFTYAVIRKQGDAHWLDVSVDQPGQKTSLQILVSIPDRNDPSQVRIQEFKVKLPGGQVKSFSGPTVAMAQKQFQNVMGRFAVPKLDGLPQEDVTVPAGRFRGCYKRDEKVEMFGLKDESTVYNHPAVPIMAMVKLVSKDGTQFELEGYGMTGAKASF